MNKKRKYYIIFTASILTVSLCTIAAMFTPPTSSHAVTTISKDGGISRHPVLLGLNKNKYTVLVTGTVKPPYKGNVKIVLEGKPEIPYKIYSRYPPELNIGIHKFHGFDDDVLTNIKSPEKFIVTVFIKPVIKIDKESKYYLKFYDLDSNNVVLTVPVIFTELDNFNLSKDVRRPYSKFHESNKKNYRQHKMDTSSNANPIHYKKRY
jgi:hypothetical protein